MSQVEEAVQGWPDRDQKQAMAEHKEGTELAKKAKNGIVLVPQPSNDPRDPLVS